MVRLVHGRDEFQSQISEGKSSTYPISFLTSKSKPLLSFQHGPLGFPSCSLREIALVRSTDHLHCQIQWWASIFILHNFLSAQSNWKASLTPFSKMTAVLWWVFFLPPWKLFLGVFCCTSSFTQPINAPSLSPGPFSSLLSCSLLP